MVVEQTLNAVLYDQIRNIFKR